VSVNTRLPPLRNYFIDESDPDIVVLRREDASFVAAFSFQGATEEGILQAAKADYQAHLGRVAHLDNSNTE
jgi:hypothetical protein